MDALDRELIIELQKDGRRSFVELAETLHISEAITDWDSRDMPRSLPMADSRAQLTVLSACISFATVLLWRDTGDL